MRPLPLRDQGLEKGIELLLRGIKRGVQDIAQAILDKIVPKTKLEIEHQKIPIATNRAKIELPRTRSA